MNREKRDKNRPTTTYTMNLKTTTPTETTMFFSNATFLFLSSFRTFQIYGISQFAKLFHTARVWALLGPLRVHFSIMRKFIHT